MRIDFSPVRSHDISLYAFSRQISLDDLRQGTNALFDIILDILRQATDEQVVFIPHDPDAYDPYAVPGEEHIGWSLAHLVAHTTASLEEGAAHSSILARGIPYPREPRLRNETPWRDIRTQAQAIERLEESRRMCLAFLQTWPNRPHLDVYRDVSERFMEKYGPQNATAAYLAGLMHMDGHLDQFHEVWRQAQQSSQAATGD